MTLLHRVEGALVRAMLRLLRALPPDRASNLGGGLARAIGMMLPVSRIADANLRRAMPELDAAARRRVVRGVWENLGRTAAELPHAGRLRETPSGPGYELVGAEHIEAVARRGGPAILFSGHIGNWEMLAPAWAAKGLSLATVYRPSDNAEIDRIILDLRREAAGQEIQHFPKGAQGARMALAHLKAGGYLALLPDQKMNDGIASRFFGQTAMTAPALAALALRFRCPVVPAYAKRIGPARFRLIVDPPLALPDTGNRTADIAALTQAVNDHLESWIRHWPQGWLWLHRRWPKASV